MTSLAPRTEMLQPVVETPKAFEPKEHLDNLNHLATLPSSELLATTPHELAQLADAARTGLLNDVWSGDLDYNPTRNWGTQRRVMARIGIAAKRGARLFAESDPGYSADLQAVHEVNTANLRRTHQHMGRRGLITSDVLPQHQPSEQAADHFKALLQTPTVNQ